MAREAGALFMGSANPLYITADGDRYVGDVMERP